MSRAVPEGWEVRTIGDVSRVTRGVTWSKEQVVESTAGDATPVLRIPNVQERLLLDDLVYISGVTDKERKRHAATKGWSLIVGSNGNPKRVGNCVYINSDNPYLFASFLLGVESVFEGLDSEYLFRTIQSARIQDEITKSVQGTTGLSNISLKFFRGLSFPLPPLPEQKKIAAILNSVDEAISATQAVIDQTRKVKEGLLHDLLTRGIGHTRFKQTEIGEIPEAWRVVKLRDIGSVKGGKRMPKGCPLVDVETPHPYIRVVDFGEGSVNMKGLRYVLPQYQKAIARYTISSCDVYISIAGSIGLAGVVPAELNGAQLTENAAKICIDDNLVSKHYLVAFLSSAIGQKQVKRATGVGGGVPKLALFRIGDFDIPLPPLSEQHNITSFVRQIESLDSVEKKKMDKLQETKSGLMQDLLSGDVRVS